MKSAKFEAKVWFYVGIGVAFALMAVWMLPQFVSARPDEPFSSVVPPRPTIEPPDTQPDDGAPPEPVAPPPPAGVNIILDVRLGETRAANWFLYWTVVQWQDAEGNWHTIDGWQGNFDQASPAGNEAKVLKTWWASDDLLGRGPFRWLVYDSREGRVIGQSEPFKMPTSAGQNAVVTISVP